MTRPGHSLAELLVALTLLGVGLAATGAAMLAAYRHTGKIMMRERALVCAAALLDSLVAVEEPADGGRQEAGLELRWHVEAGPEERLVTAECGPAGGEVVRVQGMHLGPVAVIPLGP